MKHILFCLVVFLSADVSFAQHFSRYFVDKSLRLDYAFAGTDKKNDVSLVEMSQLPQWAGRRVNLSQLGRDGNGQIDVYDATSNELIYRESFSSIFQEWQSTDEAKLVKKSFENTFLIPFPKREVLVKLSFRNAQGMYAPVLVHRVNPKDILIRKKGLKDIPVYSVLHQGGSIDKSINVVILAEGYAADEMSEFRKYAQTTCEELFKHDPFTKFKDKFNILAVETVSADAGVSVPQLDIWKNTVFSSHFDTFYSSRYLTTSHVRDLHDAIAGIPYAHIIILANTDVYGGGGIFNSYTLTTTRHRDFEPVVVHEFGHSFAGLADEYYYEGDTFDNTYPLSVEPWEPNITTLTKFAEKWEDMIKKGTPIPTIAQESRKYDVAVIEGAAYSSKGIYRSRLDCRMKTNTCRDFCPVCQRAIEQLVNFYTK